MLFEKVDIICNVQNAIAIEYISTAFLPENKAINAKSVAGNLCRPDIMDGRKQKN